MLHLSVTSRRPVIPQNQWARLSLTCPTVKYWDRSQFDDTRIHGRCQPLIRFQSPCPPCASALSAFGRPFTFARKIPTAANANPIISTPFTVSSRNSQASTAIWISMVLLMMLDSTADKCWRLRFQSWKARAVFTAPSHRITRMLRQVRCGHPSMTKPAINRTAAPTAILIVVTRIGGCALSG